MQAVTLLNVWALVKRKVTRAIHAISHHQIIKQVWI